MSRIPRTTWLSASPPRGRDLGGGAGESTWPTGEPCRREPRDRGALFVSTGAGRSPGGSRLPGPEGRQRRAGKRRPHRCALAKQPLLGFSPWGDRRPGLGFGSMLPGLRKGKGRGAGCSGLSAAAKRQGLSGQSADMSIFRYVEGQAGGHRVRCLMGAGASPLTDAGP